MKMRNILISLSVLLGIVLFSGCADKNYYYDNEGAAYIFTHSVTVKNWYWNDVLDRYESDPVALDGLNKDIFEYGTAIVSMFKDVDGVEVTKNLPFNTDFFVDKLDAQGNILKVWDYTQRVSFDMTSKDVLFYIESTKDFQLETSYFKVVILWDGIIEN